MPNLQNLDLNLFMWGYQNKSFTSISVLYLLKAISKLVCLESLGLNLRSLKKKNFLDFNINLSRIKRYDKIKETFLIFKKK